MTTYSVTTYSLTTTANTPVTITHDAIEQLRQSLSGKLVTPADEEYEAGRRIWNGMIDKKPALIARCSEATDVITVVNFARQYQLLTSVRGGGHNVSGAAIAENGLVIDLSEMNAVAVNAKAQRVRAEAGAKLGDLDRATQACSLAVPLGVVSATGIAGLTLHGGAGWQMRKRGLSIDNLLAMEIVTADGNLLKASEQEHADLFWSLRGGGGNFGVVTAFEYRAYPVGPRVWMAVPMYPLENAGKVMTAFRDFMASAPQELSAIGVFWSAPEAPEVPEEWRGKPVLITLACYTGPAEQGEQAIAPLRNLDQPIADLSGEMSWIEAQQFLDADYPDGDYYYWKSLYLDRLDDEVIATLSELTAARPSPISSIDVWMLGEAIGRIAPTATAFYHRNEAYMLGIEANWTNPDDSDANIKWAREVYKRMQPYSSGGLYLNFPGFMEEKKAVLQAAYGPNLARLQEIKAKYDPDNLFSGLLSLQ